MLLGGAIGVLAGVSSAIFLIMLDWATRIHHDHPQLLFALPFAGFAMGWVYHHMGKAANQGSHLVIAAAQHDAEPQHSRVPRRMAPFILFGTVLTHLFGGSAGREGTALQMGASLADGLRQWLQLHLHRKITITHHDRRLMVMAGMSGGFGAVFGTPMAGAVFGIEVPSIGRLRYEALLPCLVASFVGDVVARVLLDLGLGGAHTHYPVLANMSITPLLVFKIGIAGLFCGGVSRLFVLVTHSIKQKLVVVRYPPLRPVIGGVLVIALTFGLSAIGVQSADYLGLSVPLAVRATRGEYVLALAFLIKLLFTAVTLGSGFLGGEVTPLFIIGSTLGYTLGQWLGVEPAFLASLGFVAVFSGASNTPLACALMGIELFGGGSALYFLLICAMAYFVSGHRGIYNTQTVTVRKLM